MMIKIELEKEEVQTIIDALSDKPYRKVATLLHKISTAVKSQEKRPAVVRDATAIDEPD